MLISVKQEFAITANILRDQGQICMYIRVCYPVPSMITSSEIYSHVKKGFYAVQSKIKQSGVVKQMHLITWSSVSVRSSIKADVLPVC